MDQTADHGKIFRFGLFEADLGSSTLTRDGIRVKLQDQPFQLLSLLLKRPGELVTREELRQQLWSEGTYVDFDGSLNVILKRLRTALSDDPETPRYIQTVPRRGYRFIAPVSVTEKRSPLVASLTSESAAAPMLQLVPSTYRSDVAISSPVRPEDARPRRAFLYAGLAVALLLISAFIWQGRHYGWPMTLSSARASSVHLRKSVAVLGFHNLSGRTEDAWLGTALSEMLSTELAGGEKLRLISGEDIANLRVSSPWSAADSLDRGTSTRISGALNSDVLVLGSYMLLGGSENGQLRLDVRMQDGKTGEILCETAQTGNAHDLFRLVSQIGSQLRGNLGVEPLQSSEEAGVLASLPLDPQAARFYSLGVTMLRQFDALAAKDLLERAEEADPKFSLVHAMLARAWAQLGYDQKHQEEAKKAFDLSSDLPRAQRLLVEGEYYESLGKQEQAASVYHALYELFPDNVEYGLRLTAVQTLSGHGARAMEVIQKLRQLPPPSSDDPRIDLAEARAMKDDKPAALVVVRNAVRKANSRGQKLVYALARKEECMILIYGSQPDQGPPACEEAYNIFLGAGNRVAAADAVRLLGDGLGAEGRYQRAIETYQRGLDLLDGMEEHEKSGSICNNMAGAYANEGNLDRAEQLYRQARIQFQESGDANNLSVATGNIADILFLRGNLGGAEKLYQEALKATAAMDNKEPGYIYTRLADLRLDQGRIQEARHLAQDAIETYAPIHGAYPELSSAMIELGTVLEAQGDLAGARSQFQQALATQQKMGELQLAAESQSALAALSIEEGHGEAAEALLRPALAQFEKEKSDPDSSSAYTLLSHALLLENRVEDARKAAQRGEELSHTSSDPALKLPAEIQQARVEIAAGDPANLAAASRRLHSVMTNAKRLGYANLEWEARLELANVELKRNATLGLKQLKALAGETRNNGYELLARHAEEVSSETTAVAQAGSAH